MTFRGNHVDELISASLTGDLTDAERAELDAHLARCERCRATLGAFKSERRILSGLPVVGPPRDLSARVRAGIESGRGQPWWRRPSGLIAIGASLATVAAAALAIVVFGNFNSGPVGQASGSPEASLSFPPSASTVASTAPSVGPTAAPAFLAAGQLGYLELNGGSLEPLRLAFINDATGVSIDAGTVSGPPIAASLSPDGQWLAYITQKGETGANEVWALHLTDGTVTSLGCSLAAPFTDRLAWSPETQYLAYTLAGVDLGPNSGCPPSAAGVDAWLFDTATMQRSNFSNRGNAYAADFQPGTSPDLPVLWISEAAAEHPASGAFGVGREIDGAGLSDVFLPLFSPDGKGVIYWSGTMTSSGGIWQFARGGMPQVSGDAAGPWGPSQALFTDLVPVDGEAFAYGSFSWGADSNRLAFWNGAWTGTPQSADGTYPSQQNWYVGTATGLLNAESRHGHGPSDQSRTVDVAYGPSGDFAVTVGLPSAGVGDPPSALVEFIGVCCGGEPPTIGGGVDPPPWDGPAVFGR